MELVKERCSLLPDFFQQGHFFYRDPTVLEEASVRTKWDEGKSDYFNELVSKFAGLQNWEIREIENTFRELATEKNIKVGDLQMILRVMLVGTKMGPGVFIIADTIGRESTIKRIQFAVALFG